MPKKQVTWPKDQRDHAKLKDRVLFSMAIDDGQRESKPLGHWHQAGAVPQEVALEMWNAVRGIYEKWYDSLDRKEGAA